MRRRLSEHFGQSLRFMPRAQLLAFAALCRLQTACYERGLFRPSRMIRI
jgi:hypothetical protein